MALTNCCCCISLRNGSFTLAVLGSLACFLLFINGIMPREFRLSYDFDFNLNGHEFSISGTHHGFGVGIFLGHGVIVYILSNYAIIKKNADLVIPAIVWSIISTIITMGKTILFSITYISLKNIPLNRLRHEEKQRLNDAIVEAVIFIVIYAFVTGLFLYFFCVLHAVYKEFKEQSRNIINDVLFKNAA